MSTEDQIKKVMGDFVGKPINDRLLDGVCDALAQEFPKMPISVEQVGEDVEATVEVDHVVYKARLSAAKVAAQTPRGLTRRPCKLRRLAKRARLWKSLLSKRRLKVWKRLRTVIMANTDPSFSNFVGDQPLWTHGMESPFVDPTFAYQIVISADAIYASIVAYLDEQKPEPDYLTITRDVAR